MLVKHIIKSIKRKRENNTKETQLGKKESSSALCLYVRSCIVAVLHASIIIEGDNKHRSQSVTYIDSRRKSV